MTTVNTNRTFGVEIEFILNGPTRSELARRLNLALQAEFPNQAVVSEDYNHQVRNHWKIVTDASVYGGAELVSPPLPATPESFRQIEIITEAMRDNGCTVDRQCGLHVHQDANDLTVRQVGHIFGLYASFQTLISSSLAPSRRGRNQYAPAENFNSMNDNYGNRATAKTWRGAKTRKLAKTDVRQIAQKTRKHTRYSAVNIEPLATYGTIEFRQHQGTLNANKIISWVLVTQAMIERFVQHNLTWVEPKRTTKSDWKRFLSILRVSPRAVEGQDNTEVFTNAFNQMRLNIRRLARN